MMNRQEVSLAMLQMGHNQANMMNRQGMGKQTDKYGLTVKELILHACIKVNRLWPNKAVFTHWSPVW